VTDRLLLLTCTFDGGPSAFGLTRPDLGHHRFWDQLFPRTDRSLLTRPPGRRRSSIAVSPGDCLARFVWMNIFWQWGQSIRFWCTAMPVPWNGLATSRAGNPHSGQTTTTSSLLVPFLEYPASAHNQWVHRVTPLFEMNYSDSSCGGAVGAPASPGVPSVPCSPSGIAVHG
jgi:hypothetical protein